jgi:hypothetical protein
MWLGWHLLQRSYQNQPKDASHEEEQGQQDSATHEVHQVQ